MDLVSRLKSVAPTPASVWSLGIWDYRELLRNLVAKDLKLKYRGALGVFWSLLNPLAMIVVYSIAFKYILRIQLDNFTLFLITGILPWNFFSGAILASTDAVTGNAHLIKKVYFPREILPLSSITFNLIQFALSLLVFFPALLFLNAPLTWALVAYPFILLNQIVFMLGLALALSALTVPYSDMKHLTEIGLMILFWMTPVLYHFSMIPGHLQLFFRLNPMVTYITAYQDIVYLGHWPSFANWLMGVVWAGLMLGIGRWIFQRASPTFAEEF